LIDPFIFPPTFAKASISFFSGDLQTTFFIRILTDLNHISLCLVKADPPHRARRVR
jgi:hypothetical protein